MESSGLHEILRWAMTQDIEAFRRGVEAYNRRDVQAVLEVLDLDLEWHDALQVMLGGQATTVRGHEGVRGLMREHFEVFAELETEFSDVRDLGDQLVATGVIRARGRESEVEIESPFGAVVGFRNGKAIRVRTFLDPSEALEAAGLSE
jgi:ketosteroid isomerase-like protein